MSTILEQLGLDQTFFIQFGLILVLFVILRSIYFKPFFKLIANRHKKTVQDKEAAEKLMAQAQAKLEEYKERITKARLSIRKDYEAMLTEAKKEENVIFSRARAEAKQISQEAMSSLSQQRENIKKDLDVDVESLAKTITDRLLQRKV